MRLMGYKDLVDRSMEQIREVRMRPDMQLMGYMLSCCETSGERDCRQTG